MKFALFYSSTSPLHLGDPEQSFKRAAYTWIDYDTQYALPFGNPAELEQMFRYLGEEANAKRFVFEEGAIFTHSVGPWEAGGLGALYAPRLPHTLAELHDLENLKEKGLRTAAIAGDAINKLARLPWEKAAKLWLIGCNTGAGSNCVAQQFADAQAVTTYGLSGFASFSKNEQNYEPVTTDDQRIYLRTFFRNKNALRSVLGYFSSDEGLQVPSAMYNAALPEIPFSPCRI